MCCCLLSSPPSGPPSHQHMVVLFLKTELIDSKSHQVCDLTPPVIVENVVFFALALHITGEGLSTTPEFLGSLFWHVSLRLGLSNSGPRSISSLAAFNSIPTYSTSIGQSGAAWTVVVEVGFRKAPYPRTCAPDTYNHRMQV